MVQEEKETVAQYAARLTEAFNGHSGLEPRIGGGVNPRYESQLTSRLPKGLKPQIANWIKKTSGRMGRRAEKGYSRTC